MVYTSNWLTSEIGGGGGESGRECASVDDRDDMGVGNLGLVAKGKRLRKRKEKGKGLVLLSSR